METVRWGQEVGWRRCAAPGDRNILSHLPAREIRDAAGTPPVIQDGKAWRRLGAGPLTFAAYEIFLSEQKERN